MSNYKNLVGRRFGRLVVRAAAGTRRAHRIWLCACDCGQLKELSTTSLVSQGTRSCGCLRLERQKAPRKGKHKLTRTAEYRAWQSIKTRCYNVNSRSFVNYGGRGIKMSSTWRKSFVQFLKDVGHRPSPTYSLDRIDNDGDYEAGNVRWATQKQQMANRRPRSEWKRRRRSDGEWEWRGKVRSS